MPRLFLSPICSDVKRPREDLSTRTAIRDREVSVESRVWPADKHTARAMDRPHSISKLRVLSV
jgi:hypothetical protein